MVHNSIKIVFFGTPPFAVIILQKLINAGMSPAAVVTAPDKPAGRGHRLASPPVKELAEKHAIPVLQPEKPKEEAFLKVLRSYGADIFVIAAYGKILSQALLDISPKGTINVHPSLLPRHRGPSPIQSAILSGDNTTGVTLMLTDKEMDHGPIISDFKFQISDLKKITYPELHDVLATLGGDLLVQTLPKWITGEITPQEQDHAKATYTKLFTKEDGHIDWTKSADEIDRMVRALNPRPGAWSLINSGCPTSGIIPEVGHPELLRVKILQGHPTNEFSLEKPGTVTKTKNGHLAASTRDFLFVIDKLQLEGKMPVEGRIFYENNSGVSFFF